MKRYLYMLTIGLAFTAPSAWADTPVNNLPDQGAVTVSGTVDKVKNERKFSLRDNSGVVDIAITSGESVVLKQGDKVTVSGAVEKSWFGLGGKYISASNIDVHKDLKDLKTALTDAITETTGITLDDAKRTDIASLPNEGKVKLAGRVDTVENEKNFVLKDNTGAVAVNIESGQNMLLTQGAEVVVIGYVSNGMLGKKLNATKVIVTADAANAQ